ncbi:MAG: TetR/AcrR family transcriptional regulator [Xanthomonadales bacterium]|jgi:AcrR family transcriptional regulator|nr:TetR/AcrR family transcriptional regulator [Xanthomonadales bacterium]
MVQVSSSEKSPKTNRGRKTRRKILDAAELEFGEKGFHEASISSITLRAGVALGTFYTYFDSKEVIFQSLVTYMSHRIHEWIEERVAGAPDRLTAERLGIEAYIDFARQHKGIYRIISEAEYLATDAYREHYEGFARGYRRNLRDAAEKGEIREGDYEAWSWAIMGIAVFLGMRFVIMDESKAPAEVADIMTDLIARGIR